MISFPNATGHEKNKSGQSATHVQFAGREGPGDVAGCGVGGVGGRVGCHSLWRSQIDGHRQEIRQHDDVQHERQQWEQQHQHHMTDRSETDEREDSFFNK